MCYVTCRHAELLRIKQAPQNLFRHYLGHLRTHYLEQSKRAKPQFRRKRKEKKKRLAGISNTNSSLRATTHQSNSCWVSQHNIMLIYKKGFLDMKTAAKAFRIKHPHITVLDRKLSSVDNFVDNVITAGVWRSGGRGSAKSREKQHLTWLMDAFQKALNVTTREMHKKWKTVWNNTEMGNDDKTLFQIGRAHV